MQQLDYEPGIEAEYALEAPVTCPACHETLQALHVVRLLRTRVNFTSNLPRRGFAVTCPSCKVLLTASIGSKIGL